MIIVAASIKLKPGKKNAFIQGAQSVIAATRKEQGNIRYDLYASTEDENRLFYFEQWESRDALAAHQKAPHMVAWVKFREENGITDGPADVKVYDVAG